MLIARPRLQRRLDEVRATEITLIRAPAGYGKSVLMGQWAEALRASGAAVAYVDFKDDGEHGMALETDVVTAIAEAALSVRAGTPARHEPISRGSWASTLMHGLTAKIDDAGRETYLCIDDAHQLQQPAALQCLKDLLASASARIHVILSTRQQLKTPLARFRAQGRLLEIGTEDLQFNAEEIAELFAAEVTDGVPPGVVETLLLRTEGWISALNLVRQSLQHGSPISDALQNLTGEWIPIADFFAEEILAAQPEELQHLLLTTSVLDRLSGSLCEAIVGDGKGAMLLQECERRGLFITPLDEKRQWYRHHPLFAEFLRARAERQQAHELTTARRRASDWLANASIWAEAFKQALQSGDSQHAASLLDSCCESLFSIGQLSQVPALAAQLPPELQAQCPHVMLAACYQLTLEWRFEQVEALLDATRAHVEHLRRSGNAAGEEVRQLKGLLLHREALLALLRDDVPGTEQRCELLIREYTDAPDYMRTRFYSMMLSARRDQFKLSEIDRLDALALQHAPEPGAPVMPVLHEYMFSLALIMAGRFDNAITRLEAGLEHAARFEEGPGTYGALLGTALAAIHYERNEVDKAESLLQRYLPVAIEGGLGDKLIMGWLTQADIRRLRNGPHAALAALDDAGVIALRLNFERMQLAVGAARMRLLCATGRTDEARAVARQLGVRAEDGATLPTGTVTTRHEIRALLWVRLVVTENRLPEAIRVAKRWIAFLATAGAVRHRVHWEVLLVELLVRSGRMAEAHRQLLIALAVAAPARFIRVFLDEGAVVGDLVLKLDRTPPLPDDPTAHFVTELAAAFARELRLPQPAGEPEAAPLLGVLSRKETDILRMAGAGMRNCDIGARLGMTEGSVKWVLQSVFDKMGVRKRSQAIEQARRHGLIS